MISSREGNVNRNTKRNGTERTTSKGKSIFEFSSDFFSFSFLFSLSHSRTIWLFLAMRDHRISRGINRCKMGENGAVV